MARSQIDTLCVPSSPTLGSMRKTAKHVTFCDPIIDLNQPCSIPQHQGLSSLRRTASLKVSFQESVSTINGTKCKSLSSTVSQPVPALKQCVSYIPKIKTKSALKAKSTKVISPCTTAMVQDIVTLKWTFPASFDTIGNMSGICTIRTNPSITPVQHSHRKVPIEYREQIEDTLSEVVKKGVVTLVS